MTPAVGIAPSMGRARRAAPPIVGCSHHGGVTVAARSGLASLTDFAIHMRLVDKAARQS